MTLARMQQRRDTGANWAASNPVLAAGEVGVNTDTGELKVGDGTTTWNVLRGFLPGPVDYSEVIRTAGDISLTSSGWQTVTSTLDVAVLATTGDLVMYTPLLSVGAQNNALAFDVQAVTSGKYASTGTTTPATNGLAGWYAAVSIVQAVSGAVFYRVQSGDTSSGILTLRLKVNPATATTRAVAANAASPARVCALNMGALL